MSVAGLRRFCKELQDRYELWRLGQRKRELVRQMNLLRLELERLYADIAALERRKNEQWD